MSKPTDTTEQAAKTETIFDPPQLNTSEHEWLQQGYMITDNCKSKKPTCHHGGIPIGSGKMLFKDDKGNYDIKDETDVTRRR
jgi:hypothetical protein